MGEGNIGQNSLTKRTNFAPIFETSTYRGGGGVGLPFESDGVRLGFARRKIQIQPLWEINVVWLKGDFCVLSVTTPVRPNSAIYTRKRYDEHLCHFLIGALPPPRD